MTRYVALVDGKPGSYGLIVPDLPGCTSAAATTDEVLRTATEAVRLWAEDALADGEKLPKPRSVEALRRDPEVAAALAQGAVLAIVPLVLDTGRPALDDGRGARIQHQFDLIHFHCTWAWLPLEPVLAPVSLFTLHTAPQPDDEWVFARWPEE